MSVIRTLSLVSLILAYKVCDIVQTQSAEQFGILTYICVNPQPIKLAIKKTVIKSYHKTVYQIKCANSNNNDVGLGITSHFHT